MTHGLKDNEIAWITNKIRDRLIERIPWLRGYGPLRDVISHAINDYLEFHDLRLDHQAVPPPT